MLTKQEVGRQIIHALLGVVLATLYYFNILSSLAMFLGIIIGVLLSFICKRIPNFPLFGFFLKHFEREDSNGFPGKGLVFYFVGVLLVMQLFDKDIALAAIMILALGDSISHLFGAKFGKLKNIFSNDGHKLLEGTFAGVVAGFFGAVLFVPIPEAFLASLAAMFFEVVKIDFNDKTLDDNLIVPLVAGTVIYLVRIFV